MLKINPIKTLVLTAALTAGTGCIAQNKLQDAQRQLIAGEFAKADNNPRDYYITQAELNAYMGNESVNISDYDENKDDKLNIDEFAMVGSQQKTKPQNNNQQPNISAAQTYSNNNNASSSATVTAAKEPSLLEVPFFLRPVTSPLKQNQNVTKSKPTNTKNYEKEGRDIANALKSIEWPTDGYDAVKRINLNNLEYVLDALKPCPNSPKPKPSYIIKLANRKGQRNSEGIYYHIEDLVMQRLKNRGLKDPYKYSGWVFLNGYGKIDGYYDLVQ